MSKLRVIDNADTDGPSNIPARLREMADDIESGKQKARTVLIVTDDGSGVDMQCIGYRPKRSATMGLLAYASHMTFRG